MALTAKERREWAKEKQDRKVREAREKANRARRDKDLDAAIALLDRIMKTELEEDAKKTGAYAPHEIGELNDARHSIMRVRAHDVRHPRR